MAEAALSTLRVKFDQNPALSQHSHALATKKPAKYLDFQNAF